MENNLELINEIHQTEAKAAPATVAAIRADLLVVRKQPVTAWIYFILLGAWGLHRLYLGRTGTAAIMFFLNLIGLGAGVLGIFESAMSLASLQQGQLFGSPLLVVAGLCAVVVVGWVIVDFFRLPQLIERANLLMWRDMLDGVYDV